MLETNCYIPNIQSGPEELKMPPTTFNNTLHQDPKWYAAGLSTAAASTSPSSSSSNSNTGAIIVPIAVVFVGLGLVSVEASICHRVYAGDKRKRCQEFRESQARLPTTEQEGQELLVRQTTNILQQQPQFDMAAEATKVTASQSSVVPVGGGLTVQQPAPAYTSTRGLGDRLEDAPPAYEATRRQ